MGPSTQAPTIPQNIVQKVEICLKKEINPPSTMTLVQGDQSPTYYDSSPGGSIPQQIYLENLYCLENPFNPPPPRVLVQRDQCPTKSHGGTTTPKFCMGSRE